MLKFNVNQAKSQFFSAPTIDEIDKNAKKGLSRFGWLTRRAARQSMRKARQKKLAEMTEYESQVHRIRISIAQKEGKQKPKRPLASSAPGDPPKTRRGDIKKLTFFVYDKKERSVVVGPARFSGATGAPEALENGGFATTKNGRVKIAQRPFMKPAFDDHISKLPSLITGKA